MFKRLAIIAVSALVAASFGIPAAAADNNGSFTLTVNKTAYTNQFKTAITLSGTYTCAPTFVPDNSGIGINVSQIQGKGVIVTGGSGLGPLTCDGSFQTWTVTDVFANFGSGPMGGTPATWKGGRATTNVQGNASFGDCGAGNCLGIGASVDQVVQIH
jgi:hypothetical protein